MKRSPADLRFVSNKHIKENLEVEDGHEGIDTIKKSSDWVTALAGDYLDLSKYFPV